ncbi:MAG: NnrS family protein [Hyphomicrobiales bacterium]|nr:NnrS family protein [Hyphomicrobiales bacterium]
MRPPPARLPPWRVFFPAASLAGATTVALTVLGLDGRWSPPSGLPLFVWHAHEMLWGHVFAAFAGVLLTALPRWTGCAPIAPGPVSALAALWAVARLAALLDPSGAGLFASPLFLLVLAFVAGRRILAADDRRDVALVGLLGLAAFADAAFLIGSDRFAEPMLRLGFSAMLAIAAVMGGRVAPALTRHLALTENRVLDVAAPCRLEIATAVATACALAAWVVDVAGPLVAALDLAAAALHLARLVRWQGWTSLRRPSILALHVGYAGLPLGFLGLALVALDAGPGWRDAAIHAFAVGVFGVMCFAVQASVVRRHSGRPLVRDHAADLGVAVLAATLVLRFAAAASPTLAWFTVAAVGWTAAEAILFAAALRRAEDQTGLSPSTG